MKAKKELKTVIVLGAPRSGTSMTAGILSRMGVDLGKIRDPDAENPRGYYEDQDFLKLMLNIFRAVDADAHGFNPPETAQIRLQKAKFDNQIKNLVNERVSNTDSKLWGWKATTTSFTIDLFLEHLVNPHFIVVLRHPLGRAESIAKYTRNKSFYRELSHLQALAVANKYYRQIYSFLEKNRQFPHLFVSFEGTIADPLKTVDDLKSFLKIDLEKETIRAIHQFVVPRMKMKKMKEQMHQKETKVKKSENIRRFLSDKISGRFYYPDIYFYHPEINFFDKTYNFQKGIEWYESHFDSVGTAKWVGEKSRFSDVKVVVILRNPVDKVILAINHIIKSGLVSPFTSIDKLVYGSKKNIIEKYGVIENGFYYEQLAAYLEYFQREQLLILIYEEDLVENAMDGLARIYDFLAIEFSEDYFNDIERRISDRRESKQYLVARYYFPFLGPLAAKIDQYLSGTNYRLSQYARRYLLELYSEENRKLFNFMGRDIPSWNR